ncbi:MAG TPA: FtsW/RodA/SpoVE family cell cycle protein, partial [Actinomycetota bacterium]|nr:FtsW/RodA/SpoVE family cell cycle protein [Actinomycetota bacterium]
DTAPARPVKHPRLRELVLLAGVSVIYAMGFVQLGRPALIGFVSFAGIFAVLHVGMRFLAPRADPLLLPVAALLVAIGLLQIAAIDQAQISSGRTDWRSLGELQAAWLGLAAAAFLATLWIFRAGLGAAWQLRYTLALLGILAMLSPLLPGVGHTVNGARLWLRVGGLSFQPGEAAKVLLVLFFAAYLSERRELLTYPSRKIGPIPVPDPRYIAPLLGVVALALLTFVQQNDLGSSLLFFATFMAILWVATGRLFFPVAGLAMFGAGVWIALKTFSHVNVRFQAWLNPYHDPQVSGYQILMGQYAMAEGRIGGVGLVGESAQPNIIPFAWTDFILAAIGHTFGLAGVLVIVIAFVVLLTRVFYVALRSRSDLHALAAAGFGIVIAVQTLLIAGGVLRILPLTGVTLPFVSYGGSSLLANFVILAIILAISNSEGTTLHPAEQREAALGGVR